MDQRIEHAKELYERSVFGGEIDALEIAEQELDGVEADLMLARGRVNHARFLHDGTEDSRELGLFERALALYERLGDLRGQAEALFYIGIVHQVIHGDHDRAVPIFERSLAMASHNDDSMAVSYALRHLAIADYTAGRLDRARERLEESTRLRRELGFTNGVAYNLVGLAYVSHAQGRHADASAHLDEAAAIAERVRAQAVIQSITEARSEFDSRDLPDPL